jgi:HJR/Mrr/RecB family endonuclease
VSTAFVQYFCVNGVEKTPLTQTYVDVGTDLLNAVATDLT